MALTNEQSLRQAIAHEEAQLAELARKQNESRLMIDPDVLTSTSLLPDLIDADFLEPVSHLFTDFVYKGRHEMTTPV